jgi:hypothetical protein
MPVKVECARSLRAAYWRGFGSAGTGHVLDVYPFRFWAGRERIAGSVWIGEVVVRWRLYARFGRETL